MANLVLDNVVELSLPDDEIHFSPTKLLSELSEGKNAMYRKGKWVNYDTTWSLPSVDQTKDLFEKIVSRAASLITKTDTEETKRGRYYTSSMHNLGLVDGDDFPRPVILELNAKFEEEDESLARQVCLMFKNQPNRRFVIVILLARDQMAFSVFDHSGQVCSPAFNIHSEPERFLRVIAGICFCDRGTLGFDDSIDLSKRTARVADKTYKIKDIVYTVGDIYGRGTACYEVELENGKSALLKDSWKDISQEDKEWDSIKEFRDIEHRDCIPEVVAYEEVMCKGQVDTTVRLRESFLERVVTGEGDDEKVTWKWKNYRYEQVELRVHSRILMTPFGKPIEQFRSLEELLNAVKRIALVIGELAEAGRLHRDISLGNVMLQEKDGGLEALLVDYKHALGSNRQESNTMDNRIGTLAFMAIDMLDMRLDDPHAYHHDLESLFYVLCWICTVQGGPQGTRRSLKYEETQMFEWNDGGYDGRAIRHVFSDKRSSVTDYLFFACMVTSYFADYFTPIVPFIEKLRQLLFSSYGSRNSNDAEMFSSLLRVLEVSDAPDKGIIKKVGLNLPLRYRERSDVINAFVGILDEAIAALPAEQRQIPWQGIRPQAPAAKLHRYEFE